MPRLTFVGCFLCLGMQVCSASSSDNPPFFVGADGIDNLTGAIYSCDSNIDHCHQLRNENARLARVDTFAVTAAHTGDHLFVGAYLRDTNATDAGSFFRCDKSGNDCVEMRIDYLFPQQNDRFGRSLHSQNHALFIGAIGRNSTGAIFQCKASGAGCELLNFSGLNLAPGERFGSAISGIGDWLFIGATGAVRFGVETGAIYQCNLNNLVCSELPISGSLQNDRIGEDIAVSGDKLFVGAVGRANFRGSVFSCIRQPWSCIEITSPPGYSIQPDEAFGGRLLVTNKQMYISAYKRENIQGSVFVCDKQLTHCSEKRSVPLQPPVYFGSALATPGFD